MLPHFPFCIYSKKISHWLRVNNLKDSYLCGVFYSGLMDDRILPVLPTFEDEAAEETVSEEAETVEEVDIEATAETVPSEEIVMLVVADVLRLEDHQSVGGAEEQTAVGQYGSAVL